MRSLLARLVPADVDVAVDDLLRDHLEVPLNSEGGVCAAIDSYVPHRHARKLILTIGDFEQTWCFRIPVL